MTNERPQVVTGQMPDREPLDRFPQEDRNVIRWPNREVRPDPKPVPQRPPGWVRFPAKPKGKEVKLRLRGIAGLIAGVFHSMTEIGDFLQSLWKALPDDVQYRYPYTIKGMARAVYDNWRLIDWGQAMYNLAVNEIEDRIIGMLQSGRRKLGDALTELGFQPALDPGYFAGSASAYSSEEEWAFREAVREALRNTGARVYHRGSSIVGDYGGR